MTAAPALSFAPMAVHIGEEIERRRVATRMSKTAFAEAVGVDRSHVYDIIASPSIDTQKLKVISRVLQFNFFRLLAADVDEELGLRVDVAPSAVTETRAVYGRRQPAQRAPLRVVFEVDPDDEKAQAAALRMAEQLRRDTQ